jgi:hypothetical protein
MTMRTYTYNCQVCGIECEGIVGTKMSLCRQHRKEKHILDVRAGAKRQSERNKQFRIDNPVEGIHEECDNNCIHFYECQILVWQGLALPCIPWALNDNRNDFNPAQQSNFVRGGAESEY